MQLIFQLGACDESQGDRYCEEIERQLVRGRKMVDGVVSDREIKEFVENY